MALHTAKDHRGRTVPIIGPGWRVLWPLDRAERDNESAAYVRAANAVPRELRGRLLGWCVMAFIFALCFLWPLTHIVTKTRLLASPAFIPFLWVLPSLFGVAGLRRDLRGVKKRMLDANLGAGCGPSCGYQIAGMQSEADGCIVCPECGAAWRASSVLFPVNR